MNCNHIFNSRIIQLRIAINTLSSDVINASSEVQGIKNRFKLKLIENISYFLPIKMNNCSMDLILVLFGKEQKRIVFGYAMMIIKVDSSIITLSSLTEFN